MTHHPKERPSSLSRRSFLLRGAGAAVAFSAAGPLLAACGVLWFAIYNVALNAAEQGA